MIQQPDIFSVVHDYADNFHHFRSPEIPGLYLVASAENLDAVVADIPRVVEALILADSGELVEVTMAKTYSEYLHDLPKAFLPRHYVVSLKVA